MTNEEYKERKKNLLKKAIDDENKFLNYVLFCVVSNRGYTDIDMITDLSKARLELANVIMIYNDSRGNQVVINPFGPVPLSALDRFLTPFVQLIKGGISLRSIESNMEKYKAKGYDTSNLGNLIKQIISGKPVGKSYIPQGVPYTFEEKPREEMVEINPELEKFLRENETIEVNHVVIRLPEKIERMTPKRFTEHIKDIDIKAYDWEQHAIQFSDETILRFDPQTDKELIDTVMDYIRLQKAEYPFIVGLVLILEEAGKLETVKGMIDIEKRENELRQRENQLKQKENQLEQKDNQLNQKEQNIELQRKSVVDRENTLQMRENVFQQNVANAQNQQNAAAAEEIRRKDEEINRLTKQNKDLASAAEELRKAAVGVLEQKESEKESITLEKDETKKQLAREQQKTINMENEIRRRNEIENIKKQFIAKGEEIDIPMDFEINDIKNKDELMRINVVGWEGDNIKLRSGQMISIDDLIGTPANAAIFRQYVQFFNQLRGSNTPIVVLYLGIITKYNRIDELETQIESILGERNMRDPAFNRMEQEGGAVPTQQAGEGGDDGTRGIDAFIQQHQNDVPDVQLKNEYVKDMNVLREYLTTVLTGLRAKGFDFNNDQLIYVRRVVNIQDVIPGYRFLKQLLEMLYGRALMPIDVLMLSIIMIGDENSIIQFLQKIADRIIPPSSVNINGVLVSRINITGTLMNDMTKYFKDRGYTINQGRIIKGDKSVAIIDVFGNDYEAMRNYVIQNYRIPNPSDEILLTVYLYCMNRQDGNLLKLGTSLQQLGM